MTRYPQPGKTLTKHTRKILYGQVGYSVHGFC